MISQGQKMVANQKLLPQQLMLIKLLQVPASMLEQVVKEEIEKNPLLEESPNQESDNYAKESPAEDSSPKDDFEGYEYDEDSDDYHYREQLENDPNIEHRETVLSSDITFGQSLMEQLGMRPLSDEEVIIGSEIIGSIDDAGYLSRPTSLIANDLAFKHDIDTTVEEVERILAIVQSFEPAGVGARNLQECLSLQLHRIESPNLLERNAIEIIDHCFEDFSNRRYDAICQSLALESSQLNPILDIIKELNPKPGSAFASPSLGDNHYIIPDFIVSANEGEEPTFELNNGSLPSLQISEYYTSMLDEMQQHSRTTPGDKETIRFIKENAERAQWFIDMLGRRNVTLYKIMNAILQLQKEYFATGVVTTLRPMGLKDVAEKSGFDISTISRVVNQKYVQTPFGTFLLRELFSNKVTNTEGEEQSTEAVRYHLQELVNDEDKRNPITDEEIASLLKEKGYPVARRTVAKYREAMGIPPARMRKEVY